MVQEELVIVIVICLGLVSIGRLGKTSQNYYLNLGREDYYTSGGEPDGIWIKTLGAIKLGLHGKVLKQQLDRLFNGFHPDDGRQLVQNAGKPSRRPGHDACFNPPKSVSILAWTAPDHIRRIVQQCQFESVTETIQDMEREAARCRRAKGGTHLEPCAFIVAAFEHATSRALDPHLHTHCLVLNIAFRRDGTVGALDSKPLFKYKMRAGAAYRVRLGHKLEQRLGLQLEWHGTTFEIVGILRKLQVSLSKRSRVIKNELDRRGFETAAAAAVVALDTRDWKDHVPPREELIRHCRQVANRFGLTQQKILELVSIPSHPKPDLTPKEVHAFIAKAPKSNPRQSRCISRTQRSKHTQSHSSRPDLGHSAVNPPDVTIGDIPPYTGTETPPFDKQTRKALARLARADKISVSQRRLNRAIRHYSHARSPKLEELKYHAQQFVAAARKKDTKRVDRNQITAQAKVTLHESHIDALKEILTGPGCLKTLSGYKREEHDLILRACNDVWHNQTRNFRVIGVSLSRQGAARLERETGIASVSLRKLELMMKPTLLFRFLYLSNLFIRTLRGQPFFSLKHFHIDQETVVVLDCAERLNPPQLKNLLRQTAKHKGQIVLVDGHTRDYAPYTSFHEIDKYIHFKPTERRSYDVTQPELIQQTMQQKHGWKQTHEKERQRQQKPKQTLDNERKLEL